MPEEEKKTVDIDTSGPETEINVAEEKDDSLQAVDYTRLRIVLNCIVCFLYIIFQQSAREPYKKVRFQRCSFVLKQLQKLVEQRLQRYSACEQQLLLPA